MKINNYLLIAFYTVLLSACSTAPEDEQDVKDVLHTNQWPGYKAVQVKIDAEELEDMDHDGVIDNRDLCLDTMIGVKVNNDGCARVLGDINSKEFSLMSNASISIKLAKPKEFEYFVSKTILSSANKDKFILVEAFVFTEPKHQFLAEKSFDAGKNIAQKLVEQYGVSRENIKVSANDGRVITTEDLIDDKTGSHVHIYVVDNERIDEVQWNVWSVELKDKHTEASSTKRFINYTNLVRAKQ